MVLGIQIVGILFAIVMFYLTFHTYKRGQLSKQSVVLWGFVWIGVFILSLFPQIISGIGGKLNVTGTIDFITLIGFSFFAVLMFYLHQKVNKMENRVEKLVRTIANERAEIKNKK